MSLLRSNRIKKNIKYYQYKIALTTRDVKVLNLHHFT